MNIKEKKAIGVDLYILVRTRVRHTFMQCIVPNPRVRTREYTVRTKPLKERYYNISAFRHWFTYRVIGVARKSRPTAITITIRMNTIAAGHMAEVLRRCTSCPSAAAAQLLLYHWWRQN